MIRESLIYTIGRALPAGISFVTGMVLTWLLAPAEYGVYGLGTALIAVLSSAFFGWHGLSFMRFYQAGVENPRFMPTVVQSFLLLCLLSAAVALPIGFSGLLERDYQELIWICVPGAWCYSWFELAARIEVARFHPARFFWMNCVRNTGILVLGVALAWATRSPLLVLAGSFVAMLAAGLAFNSGGLGLRPRWFDRKVVAQLFTFGWPVAIMLVIATSSFAIDRFLLEHYSGTAEVGFYTVAYALAQTSIATLGTGIDSAVYSRAVQALDQKDMATLQQQMARCATMLLAVMTPAAVGLAMVAPGLTRLLVDPDYVQPVSALIAWLAIAALIAAFRANYTDRIFHLGHATFGLTMVMATMVTVNVIADLLLIPKYGAVGCGMASVIAATVGLVHGTLASRAVMRLPFPKRDAVVVLAATGVMALFLWPFYGATGVLVLLVQIIGGMVVFGAVALAGDVMGLRARVLERVRGKRGGRA